MQWISRVVGGWNVRMTRRGKRHSKFFSDASFSGKKKSLIAAKAYRDQLLATRPEPKSRSPRPIVVSRGKTQYVQVRIPTAKGTTTTEFSITRHGPKKARSLAIAAFKAAINDPNMKKK